MPRRQQELVRDFDIVAKNYFERNRQRVHVISRRLQLKLHRRKDFKNAKSHDCFNESNDA